MLATELATKFLNRPLDDWVLKGPVNEINSFVDAVPTNLLILALPVKIIAAAWVDGMFDEIAKVEHKAKVVPANTNSRLKLIKSFI